MWDAEIQRCTRHCAKTNRELQPGEIIYSVLVPEGVQVVRYDYGADAWEDAPASALGWWRSRIPEANATRVHWAPSDVMLHYFEELEGQDSRCDERYILTLLLLRRRIVRCEDTERDAAGRETMVLYCPRNEKEYRVAVAVPTPDRTQAIQQELARLLLAGNAA